jgi:hypothetical protein
MSKDSRKTTTRRGALHLLAAASLAMTLPATVAVAEDHPDADILRMADALNQHLDVYLPKVEAVTDAIYEWEEREGNALRESGQPFRAWQDARNAQPFSAENDATWAYYNENVQPLENAIVRTPAKTIDGLAAKAAMVKRFIAAEMWDDTDEDANWDTLAVRKIAEEAIAIAAAAKA